MVDDKAEHFKRLAALPPAVLDPEPFRRGLLEVRQNSEPGSRRTPADERQQTTLSPPFDTPLLAISYKGIHRIHDDNAAVAQGLPPLSSPATTRALAAHLCRTESSVWPVLVFGAQRTGSLSYQITGYYHSRYCSSVQSSLWATKCSAERSLLNHSELAGGSLQVNLCHLCKGVN